MAGEVYTNSFSTAISDINVAGSAVSGLLIGDKKIVYDISDVITNTDPNRAPFLRFLEKVGSKEACTSFKFEWLEEEDKALAGTINDSGTNVVGSASEKTLVTDESDLFVAGDILRFIDVSADTFEIVRVDSKTNATTYEVTRAYSGTTGLTTFADGDEVVKMGSAFAENTTSADPDSIEPTWLYNLCQNFKSSVEISGRMDAMEVRGAANEITAQLQSRMRSHIEAIENAYMWGERSYEASSNSRTTLGGLKYHVNASYSTNEVDASSSTFNETYLDNLSNQIFRYGSDRKVALVSGPTLAKISSFNKPYLRNNKQASARLGIAVTDYDSAHGTLSLIHSRALERSAAWTKKMVIFDPQFIKKRFLRGRDTRILTNVQANDQDGKKHSIESDISLEVRNAKAHLIISEINNTIS